MSMAMILTIILFDSVCVYIVDAAARGGGHQQERVCGIPVPCDIVSGKPLLHSTAAENGANFQGNCKTII